MLAEFERAEAAIGPVYDIAQIVDDPQYQAREDIVTIADEDLGPLRMTNAFPFLSETPARIRHAGPRLGQHTHEVLREDLGLSAEEIEHLARDGSI